MSSETMRKERLDLTGTGVGGSGGVAEGAVEYVLMEDAGHFVPFEKVQQTASHIGTWLGKDIERWQRGEEEDRRMWESIPPTDKMVMSKQFRYYVKEGFGPNKANEAKPKI